MHVLSVVKVHTKLNPAYESPDLRGGSESTPSKAHTYVDPTLLPSPDLLRVLYSHTDC